MTDSVVKTIDPFSGETVAEFKAMGIDQFRDKARLSRVAQAAWKVTPIQERAEKLRALGDSLERDLETGAQLITREMGKPISAARAEVEKCVGLCRFYADKMASYLSAEDREGGRVVMEPLGVILGVMPWNYPLWQVIRFAVPTIASGNAVLLKHADNVTSSSVFLEQSFAQAGFPGHLFQALVGSHETVKEFMAAGEVNGVSLTGSVRAGKAVAAQAGEALVPSIMELGGSDPYIVLADANLQHAARVCAKARLQNSGQTCIAAKRFIVVKEVRAAFVELLQEEFAKFKSGDPKSPDTDLGPLAKEAFVEDLQETRNKFVAAGAVSIHRNQINSNHQGFYSPEILLAEKNVKSFGELEAFGPLALVIEAVDEQDAVSIANNTVFGLGAAIFSENIEKATHLAENEVRAGSVAINAQVTSQYDLPFGGVGDSGYGRELSREALSAFVNVKVVQNLQGQY